MFHGAPSKWEKKITFNEIVVKLCIAREISYWAQVLEITELFRITVPLHADQNEFSLLAFHNSWLANGWPGVWFEYRQWRCTRISTWLFSHCVIDSPLQRTCLSTASSWGPSQQSFIYSRIRNIKTFLRRHSGDKNHIFNISFLYECKLNSHSRLLLIRYRVGHSFVFL